MKIYEIITPVAPPIKPGTPPPPAAPATPTPKIQQDMKSMSDQFTALKLKYDQLQKQILTPQA